MDVNVDIAVIGAGTAGLSAFKEAGKFTKNIILIDNGPLGTTCARVGCMPSKVFIQAANDFYNRHYFAGQGISGADKLTVDIVKALQHVRDLRDYFTAGIKKYVNGLGDQFYAERAEFVEPNVLQVGNKRIVAKSIIIASGSSSIMPPPWQAFSDSILTSDNFFEQQSLPNEMVVIGAGIIGLELGQALSRLGINISMFNAGDTIGALSDPKVNEVAISIMQQEFPLFNLQQANLEKGINGVIVKSDAESKEAEKILAALGRRPNLSSLQLEKFGIHFDHDGCPNYDIETMQVGKHPIFIAGDANKIRPLLHEAADEGRIAGFNAAHDNIQCFKRRTPLAIVFSQPNIAIVGKSFEELKNQEIIIGAVSFDDQGRSRIMHKNKGILRIYAEPADGKILGAEMIAPAGEHLAHMISWAIQKNMTAHEMLQMPFYHPVVQEGLRTAVRDLASKVKKSHGALELTMCDSEAIGELS